MAPACHIRPLQTFVVQLVVASILSAIAFHLNNQSVLTTPESVLAHLETRFSQLNAATELELWQEAYRTVEDVHSLIQQMKRFAPPRTPPSPCARATPAARGAGRRYDDDLHSQ